MSRLPEADVRKQLCLALDVATVEEACVWVRRMTAHFGTFKIGLRLFCAQGPSVVDRVREAGAERIFLDLKLHDIPQTVADAVSALTAAGPDLLTVHTAGGAEMLRRAQAATEGRITLLGVTVLTSLDASDLSSTGCESSPLAVTLKRARLAVDAGLGGLVCSPEEVSAVRTDLGELSRILVTPGIRPSGGELDDQRRVATPREAVRAGANLLVIGRPVLTATRPEQVCEELFAELSA